MFNLFTLTPCPSFSLSLSLWKQIDKKYFCDFYDIVSRAANKNGDNENARRSTLDASCYSPNKTISSRRRSFPFHERGSHEPSREKLHSLSLTQIDFASLRFARVNFLSLFVSLVYD